MNPFALPTKKVRTQEGDEILINHEDFDPSIHEEITDAPKKIAKRGDSVEEEPEDGKKAKKGK